MADVTTPAVLQRFSKDRAKKAGLKMPFSRQQPS
jgi:hypothetical protein